MAKLRIALIGNGGICRGSHIPNYCEDERVEVVIYEMLSGVKYTTTLNMVAGEVYTIDTPWGAGLYTIRITQTDGTILEGDFQIK